MQYKFQSDFFVSQLDYEFTQKPLMGFLMEYCMFQYQLDNFLNELQNPCNCAYHFEWLLSLRDDLLDSFQAN